ncbi:MAG: LPS export ABC transporter permease LptG [Lautropia sp.]|nr:LPS export ABC transporter permease LptG [Lautropia sp.]
MRLIGGYLIREISLGILAVLFGFLALFAFFDLINELEDIGRAGYRLQHAVLYVLLSLPGHVYELMPVAALIGCIYALSQFAGNSEFTAMRAAGMSRYLALRSIVGIGVVLAILTAIAGEWVAPVAEQLAQKLRLNVLGASQGGTFRSGLWIKDSVKDSKGQALRLRFVNIGNLTPEGRMERVEIHEFDPGFRLSSVIRAAAGIYQPEEVAGGGTRSAWKLNGVEQTRFEVAAGESGIEALRTRMDRAPELIWESDLNPGILAVLTIAPDRMSAWALWRYTSHLRENSQNADRYELALWKKIVYPVAIIVMLMLALPFAYLQSRAGGIGLKLFLGVMLGVGFYFMNGLFSNLGLLNTWPPWLAVSIPSMVAFALALAMLGRVGRSY